MIFNEISFAVLPSGKRIKDGFSTGHQKMFSTDKNHFPVCIYSEF